MNLMTVQETADYLNVPVGTLRYWRHQGKGPKSFRLGTRKVMYRQTDVDAWLMEQIHADEPQHAS